MPSRHVLFRNGSNGSLTGFFLAVSRAPAGVRWRVGRPIKPQSAYFRVQIAMSLGSHRARSHVPTTREARRCSILNLSILVSNECTALMYVCAMAPSMSL
jgi:hypothetical protein